MDRKKIAEEILRLRFSQMTVNEGIKKGRFKIPIHLAMGHESIAVAISSIMGKKDKLVLSHRNIAYNLARLGSFKKILDEYLLKPTGLNRGKSGSMNLANSQRGIIYTSSILGNNFPVATGAAMAEKMLSKKGLVIVLGGDGSIEEGSFYESLTLAKTLGLSILFIIENNEWALATRIKERRCHIDLASLSMTTGIKYAKFSGNDPYKYIANLKKLWSYSLSKKEPACIEVRISTLGYWRGPVTPQYPKGKFINYHAGASPSVNFISPPIISKDSRDPVFVLGKYFKKSELEKMCGEILKKKNLLL